MVAVTVYRHSHCTVEVQFVVEVVVVVVVAVQIIGIAPVVADVADDVPNMIEHKRVLRLPEVYCYCNYY